MRPRVEHVAEGMSTEHLGGFYLHTAHLVYRTDVDRVFLRRAGAGETVTHVYDDVEAHGIALAEPYDAQELNRVLDALATVVEHGNLEPTLEEVLEVAGSVR